MGRTIKERAGVRYGRLVARYVAAQTLNKQAMWYCDCDCGGYSVVEGSKLERGGTRSCGCYKADVRRNRPMRPLEERFWQYVVPESKARCWEWRGAVCNTTGYGVIGVGRRSDGLRNAHSVSYEIHYGQIPEGHEICHHCDNRKCVNPHHLFSGTRLDNVRDMISKGRAHFQQVKHGKTKNRLSP